MRDVLRKPIFHDVEVPMPTKEDITDFAVGKQIVTPTGNKITQYSFKGRRVRYTWSGLSKQELDELKVLLDSLGYEKFDLTLTTGEVIKVVLDGMQPFTYNKRYNYVAGRIRYNATLSFVEVPA